MNEIVTLRLPAAGGRSLLEALASFGRCLAADVRVVIVTGSGPDVAGPDFAAWRPPADGSSEVSGADDGTISGWLRRPDIITVAVLRGEVTGSVLRVAFACDLRLAADDAVLSLRLDSEPDALGDLAVRLTDLIGYAKALEFVIAGRRLSGREAERLGLVNRAVPSAQLAAAADELASAIVATPRETATEAKALLSSALTDGRARAADMATAFVLARGET